MLIYKPGKRQLHNFCNDIKYLKIYKMNIKPFNALIEKQIEKQFKTWAAFSRHLGKEPSNFKRTLKGNINKLNSWIKPLGLYLKISKISNK
jgi:hypothetical protein